jgi:hypothetical protein
VHREHAVDEEREERVHGADVVEHVAVVQRAADKEDEEVEPPQHLREAAQREVGADVVVAEVAEAGHPHVGCDEQPDRVVHFFRLEVVVQQEKDLHPPLPLLRLVAVQQRGHLRGVQ